MQLAAGTRLYTVSSDGHLSETTFQGVLLTYVGGGQNLDCQVFTDREEAQASSDRIKLNLQLLSSVRELPLASVEKVIKYAMTKQGLVSANTPLFR